MMSLRFCSKFIIAMVVIIGGFLFTGCQSQRIDEEEKIRIIEIFNSNDYNEITNELLCENNEEIVDSEKQYNKAPLEVDLLDDIKFDMELEVYSEYYKIFDYIASYSEITTECVEKNNGEIEIHLVVNVPDMSGFFNSLDENIRNLDDMVNAVKEYVVNIDKKLFEVDISYNSDGTIVYDKLQYTDAMTGGLYSAYVKLCEEFFDQVEKLSNDKGE